MAAKGIKRVQRRLGSKPSQRQRSISAKKKSSYQYGSKSVKRQRRKAHSQQHGVCVALSEPA